MKIAVTAPKGKMGALIIQAIADRQGQTLHSVIAPAGRPYLGQDAGFLSGVGSALNVAVTDDWNAALTGCDVLIDFSTIETAREALTQCLKHRTAYVCGTTGFSAEDRLLFEQAAASIPVLHAANTSRVVHLMKRLLRQAAAELSPLADMEIVEMHDRNKLDAPSGTSRELGKVLCDGAGLNWDEAAVFGRHGAGRRAPGELGYHSLRAGDISSSHTVLFGLLGERLEITHHAHNWRCFAEGALDCALFLEAKEPGLYSVEQAFNGV